MKQAMILFKDRGGHVEIQLDPAEQVPVFIIDGVFYVKGNDKKTHYFPMCNVFSVTVG